MLADIGADVDKYRTLWCELVHRITQEKEQGFLKSTVVIDIEIDITVQVAVVLQAEEILHEWRIWRATKFCEPLVYKAREALGKPFSVPKETVN